MGVAGPAAAMGQPVPGAGSVPAGTSTGGKEHFLATTDLLQACQWCPAQTNLVDAPTGVAKVRSGSADSPVTAASSTAQSVPVPLPGKNPTGLPVGQSNSASLPASSTHAPTHGTVVPLQRTSSAPLQPGWHHGGVAKVRSGSADSPVTAASSTAQSVPVPLPGKNPTGLPVGQSNSASLPASSTHAPTHGTVVPLQRTSSAPLQPGWHHGDVGKDIRENTDTRWQELFNIKLQIVQYLKAVFVVCVVAATFFLILVLVLCCTAACYCLKKAMG
ncbi:mucin-5AC-like [Pogoniulus pusillus]|uniref:mucin-5AC-like n=1 Tax=Pogoniulus pusillus TaxID=488313 RepID=UPI0030B922AF